MRVTRTRTTPSSEWRRSWNASTSASIGLNRCCANEGAVTRLLSGDGRLRRWAKKLGLVLLELVVVLTVVSVVYNVATRDHVEPARALLRGTGVTVTADSWRGGVSGAHGTAVLFVGLHRPELGLGSRRAATGARPPWIAIDVPDFRYAEREVHVAPFGRPRNRLRATFECGSFRSSGHWLGAARKSRCAAVWACEGNGDVDKVSGLRQAALVLGERKPASAPGLRAHSELRRAPTGSRGAVLPAPIRNQSSVHASVPGRVGAAVQGPGNTRHVRSMLKYQNASFTLQAQLRAVRVPALVLWGAHDTVRTIQSGRTQTQPKRYARRSSSSPAPDTWGCSRRPT